MPNQYGIANVIIPRDGPKTVPQILNWNGNSEIDIDCSQIIQLGLLEYVQCIYVDNLDNPNKLTIIVSGTTNQRIVVGAGVQGYFSILAPNEPVFKFTTTAGAFTTPIQLINVPVQPDQWKP